MPFNCVDLPEEDWARGRGWLGLGLLGKPGQEEVISSTEDHLTTSSIAIDISATWSLSEPMGPQGNSMNSSSTATTGHLAALYTYADVPGGYDDRTR